MKASEKYRVVGRRGDEGEQFLLVVADAPNSPDVRARVLDMEQKKLFPWMQIGSILKWGYWEEHTCSEKFLAGLLKEVEEVEKA